MGLCVKCGDKYYPGHQCNPKTVNLIQEINDRIVPEDDELTQSEEIGAETEEALISMQATSGNPLNYEIRGRSSVPNL